MNQKAFEINHCEVQLIQYDQSQRETKFSHTYFICKDTVYNFNLFVSAVPSGPTKEHERRWQLVTIPWDRYMEREKKKQSSS